MKIAFFVSAFPVRSETFVVSQIAGLVDRGHDVDIYTNVVNDPSHLHSDFAQYGLLARTKRRRSVFSSSSLTRLAVRLRALFVNGIRRPVLFLRCLNVFRYGKRAVSLDVFDLASHFLDHPTYDVVHCHFGPNGDDAAILKELGLLSGKLVVTFHLYDVQRGIETKGRVYRRLVQAADAVHSISGFNRKWLGTFGFPPSRIHYHPMGIRLPPPHVPAGQRATRRRVTVLTVARLVAVKGLDLALTAMAAVLRRRPDVLLRYRIIGGGPLAEFLQRRALQLGLQEVIEFCGPQDQEAVRAALAEADIFLLPSLAEALPVAIMEAMAFGLPVIATDVGSVAELVRDGETGCLVPPGDSRALEKALLDLLATRDSWPLLGAAGRRLVAARHDIATLSGRLEEHYGALVSRSDRFHRTDVYAAAG